MARLRRGLRKLFHSRGDSRSSGFAPLASTAAVALLVPFLYACANPGTSNASGETPDSKAVDRITEIPASVVTPKPVETFVPYPRAEPTDNGPFSVTPGKAKDGGVVVVTLKIDPARPFEKLAVSFEGEKFPVIQGADPKKKYAIVAVPFNSKPRETKVVVEYADAVGAPVKKAEVPLIVIDGNYRHETLKVQADKANPPASQTKRILAEQKEVGALYRIQRKEVLWSGRFDKPIDSEVTSPFGNKRVFNGSMKSFHQGMDFRAKPGTPIKAPEGGAVVLAKDLFFTGWTIILDHGYGFFTIYCHMTEMKAGVGDIVKKGEVIGLSGSTGRVSGPHLHWGAVIERQKVDPENLLRVLPVAL